MFSEWAPTTSMPPGPCAMQQHPYYADALREIGANVTTLLHRSGQRRMAQVQIVSRRMGPVKLTWLPRGPVWASGLSVFEKRDILQSLQSYLPNGTTLISIPDGARDQPVYARAGHRPMLGAGHVAEIALTHPVEVRLAAQTIKRRNRLRHAQKGPLRISHRPFDRDRDTWLLEHDQFQQRQKRYRALPAAFTLAWAKHHSCATRLFFAHLQGRIVAAMLILRHPPTASYHIGWSGPEGRRHSAHNLLHWQAANWLAEQGCQRLDLGHVDPRQTPGLARFKLGSGANLRALGPTMLRLPRITRRRIAA